MSILSFILRKPMAMLRGRLGEKKVSLNIWLNLDANVYRPIDNLIIPSQNGTIQIDHVLVSPYGVFIIETKRIKGWIFGSNYQPQWTQVLFGKKYQFQNPLRQTFRQKKGLSEYLGLTETFIHDIVYFTGNCQFKTILPKNVLNSGLSRYIRQYNDVVLSQLEIELLLERLYETKTNPELTTRNHVKSLRDRYASYTICPKCSSSLVTRNSRNGSTFLGCSNYPRCKFTKNLAN